MKPPSSLRTRALEAARALLEEGGVEALHLRTIAGRIESGVASLYYHFGDKEGLLAALALEGYWRLNAALREALTDPRFGRPIDAVSSAYLRFLQGNLQLYALMHSKELLASRPEMRQAEQESLRSFEAALGQDERVPPERVEDIALACWVLGRGMADLILARGPPDPRYAREVVEKVVRGFGYLLSPEFVSSPQRA
jgi:AcrR family transcriptional regulator